MHRVIPFFISCVIALHCQAQSVSKPLFPEPPPIADADPALRTEQEVLVPTSFKVFRTANVMVFCDDYEPLKPTKLIVGSKMVLGMSTKLYIYPLGGVRPSEPNRQSLGGLPRRGRSGKSFFYPKRDGFLVPGKPCIVELEVVVFETDIPAQHMWMPQSDKYKVLWRTSLQQTVEERPQLPDDIREEMERVKAQPVPPPVGGRVTAGAAAPVESEPGFVPLFDGTSLDGWEQKGNWVIEDGALFRKEKGGNITCTARTVPDDFELRFEWKVSKGCNSGVYYRPGQYEYQVLDNAHSPYGENPRQSAASLFFCMAPSKDASRPLGEWNEGRVVCKGAVIQHWLNGEKVIDFDYTDPRWAKEVELLSIRGADLGARGGRVWLQDHGAPVWFRNIRLRAIPATEKLERSDFTPMPIPPAALEKENARVQQMLKAKEKK